MIYIIAQGTEIIDPRPEAEIAQSERDYFEERYNRDLKRKLEKKHTSICKKALSCMWTVIEGRIKNEANYL